VPGVAANKTASLVMLNAGAGQPAGSLAVGVFPTSVAEDEATQRVFVLDRTAPVTLTTTSDDVSEIDTAHGVVLRHVPAGANAHSIAYVATAAGGRTSACR
jgi:hypothetical protein